jgi:nucleoside-diphosphate-sugar epimerase
MSHVVPDLVQKVLRGQDPLHILGDGTQLRHYTYGGDLARGIRLSMESSAAVNEDFNLSTRTGTSVLELAGAIWSRIREGETLRCVSDAPYRYDVRRRSPEVSKAERVLGFVASTTLDQMLDEVVPWIAQAMREGTI